LSADKGGRVSAAGSIRDPSCPSGFSEMHCTSFDPDSCTETLDCLRLWLSGECVPGNFACGVNDYICDKPTSMLLAAEAVEKGYLLIISFLMFVFIDPPKNDI
jgi:hypothetical protein